MSQILTLPWLHILHWNHSSDTNENCVQTYLRSLERSAGGVYWAQLPKERSPARSTPIFPTPGRVPSDKWKMNKHIIWVRTDQLHIWLVTNELKKSIVLKLHFQVSHFCIRKDVSGSNASCLGPLRKQFFLHSFINIYQMLSPVLGNMGTVWGK